MHWIWVWEAERTEVVGWLLTVLGWQVSCVAVESAVQLPLRKRL